MKHGWTFQANNWTSPQIKQNITEKNIHHRHWHSCGTQHNRNRERKWTWRDWPLQRWPMWRWMRTDRSWWPRSARSPWSPSPPRCETASCSPRTPDRCEERNCFWVVLKRFCRRQHRLPGCCVALYCPPVDVFKFYLEPSRLPYLTASCSRFFGLFTCPGTTSGGGPDCITWCAGRGFMW